MAVLSTGPLWVLTTKAAGRAWVAEIKAHLPPDDTIDYRTGRGVVRPADAEPTD